MERLYFDGPLPKVHFMKLLSCSLYNSWDTLTNEGSAGLVDEKNNSSGSISKLAAGNYDLDSLGKKYQICSLNTIDHLTVVGLVTWPLNGSEAGVDLVLIQTSLLLLCKSSCSYAN